MGDFRFTSVLRSDAEAWPWYLGGPDDLDDSVSNLAGVDKWFLSLFAGPVPPPAYESAAREPDPPIREAGPPPTDPSLPPPGRPTPTQAPEPVPAVKVEILNDCGIKGAADGIARALERPGIDIVFVGNTPRYRYRSTRVQSSVGVPVVLQEILERMGFSEASVERVPAGRRKADVTVIVGRDYRKVLERMNARSAD
jgi:hypothetical protein